MSTFQLPFLPPVFALLAAVVSRLFPTWLHPAPRPNCSLLDECNSLAKRFFAVSVVVAVAIWSFGLLMGSRTSGSMSFEQRISLAIACEVWNVGFLIAAVVRAATQRASDPKAVLGERQGVGPDTDIALRIVTNTTEQLLIGALLRLALALSAPPGVGVILPALSAMWLAGRVLFLLGYSASNPMGRELGFDLTLMSSLSIVPYLVLAALLGR